jgi:hypothetical protein
MAEYKQPVDVANADIYFSQDPNKLKAQDLNKGTGVQRVSAGDPGSNVINRHGELETRGNGAATKGRKARGPLA